MSAVPNELKNLPGVDARELVQASPIRSVYVYEAPVRLWHWVNALAITVLGITGYLIGSPLPTMPGEASDHFGLVGRVYWALVGNHHARELFTVPIFSKAYWEDILVMFRWYAFLIPQPNRYVGHNPLARFAMFFVFVLLSLFMIASGFALYGEGLGMGSWADKTFGWIIPLMGQSQDVHTWHHLGLWVMVSFIFIHVYAAIREDIMGRQSVVSTMVSGYRTFKD
jgi:Ni/Fe-hydrogenase 1 B-type cytochrome subunit